MSSYIFLIEYLIYIVFAVKSFSKKLERYSLINERADKGDKKSLDGIFCDELKRLDKAKDIKMEYLKRHLTTIKYLK